jgi:hypothetical protein
MEKKQFEAEDLKQIEELQEKYSTLGIQLVQLKLAKKNVEDYLKALNEQEVLIESEVIETNNKEKELAKVFDQKYGAGSLDLKTGEFIPKS